MKIRSKLAVAAAALVVVFGSLFHSASANDVLPFNDIRDSYAKNEIITLYNKGIITGTSKTTYSPAKSVTRAEFITMMDRLLKLEPAASPVSPFTDVPKNAWFYGWIQAAVQLELASGTSATTFAPSDAVTRQEAAVLIVRAFKQSGAAGSYLAAYKDESNIASWARSSVAAVNKLGLMKGDDTSQFRPNDSMTRQETAMLLARVLQNKKWAAELDKKTEERIVMGWQYGQTTAEYKRNILKSNVNTLSPRWYFVDAAGSVPDSTDASLITWAKDNGKKVWAMVGNRSDQNATHQMLSNSKARNAAVDQLTAYVIKYGLDGLNVDFENVAPKDRADLTAFITALGQKLHAAGATLSMDVSPDLGTDWTDAFDYAALGKQVDYMVMMGYDEYYSGSSKAGPNASLPYVQNAINTLLKQVPNHKVILAVPFYNRDWTLKANGTAASSEYISLTEQNAMYAAIKLKPVWNKTLGQYVASYTKQSVKHTIWLEDGRSLTAKYKIAMNQHLAGVAYWYIGGESSDIWVSIDNAERFYDYKF